MSDNQDRNELSDAEIEALVETNRIKGYRLRTGESRFSSGAPGCWIGGNPTLPKMIEWPYYCSKYQPADVPMIFIAQIDCAQFPVIEDRPEIPRSGTLFFFYDPIFDSEHHGAGQVIYIDADLSDSAERRPPDLPQDEVDYSLLDYELVNADHQRIADYWFVTPIRYDEWWYRDVVLPLPTNAGCSAKYDHQILKKTAAQDEEFRCIFGMKDGTRVSNFTKNSIFGARFIDNFDNQYYRSWIPLAIFDPYQSIGPFDISHRSLVFLIQRDDLINRSFENVVVTKSS